MLTRRSLLKSSLVGLAAVSRGQRARADLGLLGLKRNMHQRQSLITPLKLQAMRDYQTSMAPFGGSLACRPEQLRDAGCREDFFDVVIVGSGYGGAICAARLAQRMRPGARIAVLERGREWIPGTFPDSLPQLLRESRYGLFGPARQRIRNPLGLYDLTFHDEVFVMAGSGLGGGSLINAGVAALPDLEVFHQPCWPFALQNRHTLDPFYDCVARTLNLQTIDQDTHKTLELRRIAGLVPKGRGCASPALVTVNFRGQGLDTNGRNEHGVIQRHCKLCGDCSTGCNIGAKNTLPTNYLPIARRCGAELYTQTEVHHIERSGPLYRVRFTQLPRRETEFEPQTGCIQARIVILAAGSLGTSGILLRSQHKGLRFSDRLGHQWSGNGDTYGFLAGGKRETNVGGFGAHTAGRPPVGVMQQVNLKLDHPQWQQRLLLQEGAVPRAFANALGGLVADLDLDRSLPFFAIGHDGADGRVTLRDGRPAVTWPERPTSGYTRWAHGKLRELAKLGGGYYRKPESLGRTAITVHPLGGCPMGDAPDCGVTTDLGEVYDTGAGWDPIDNRPAVHEGLYVADGALIPTSLGSNPFFTIAALAERTAAGICSDPRYGDLFS